MGTVELKGLSKVYDGADGPAVDRLDLDIAEGEFMVLVGPSGCGKSTALRMVAGLESISGGELLIGGKIVNDVSPKDRDIAMVFQNYALYPHMSVRKNIGYPLRVAGVNKAEIDRRVEETAKVLQLEELLDRKPGQLSGGQRQRVAMGRALVRQPQVFLMDEPLSNLDAKLRVYMRTEITAIQQNLGIMTIYVTHDQVEAMTMGDRVAVLKDGVLQQVDTPRALYDTPANLFVAGFIGSPAMNLFESTVHLGDDPHIEVGDQRLELPTELAARPALAGLDGASVVAGIRPDDCYDASIRPEYPGRLGGQVHRIESLGSEIIAHLDLGVTLVQSGDPDLDELGDTEEGTTFIARVVPSSLISAGDRAELAIDTAKLHFFDPATGRVIR